MNYENLTDEQLDELFDAAHKIKELFELEANWKKLILDDEVYRKIYMLIFGAMSEMQRRKKERFSK